jgi:hypothetical protein
MERIQLPLPLEILHELERSIDPRCLSTGGAPNWDTLYFHHHPDLAHLSPTAKLVPRATWQRQLALGPSPFSFTKSIASYLPPEPETMTTARPYTERQKRRFYQRLLTEVPLINHFDGTDMWRTDFSLSRSRLAIGKKMVVIEIPKEVQEAMSNGTKGKKKKDKKKDKMVDK